MKKSEIVFAGSKEPIRSFEVKNPTLAEIETTIRPWSVEKFKDWALKYNYSEADVDQWLSEQPSEPQSAVRIESNETK